MTAELERVRTSLRGELVPYGAYDAQLGKRRGGYSIPIERPPKGRRSG